MKRSMICPFILVGVILVFIPSQAKEKQGRFPKLKGPFLGQTPPGAEPVLFAPDLISTGMYERDMSISPDGREIHFALIAGPVITIMTTRSENGVWTEPKAADFASKVDHGYFEPCLSADGQKILFLCLIPQVDEKTGTKSMRQDIWAADRLADGGWSAGYDIGAPVNTDDSEFFPSLTRDNTLYFTRSGVRDGKMTVMRSKFVDGKYLEPEALPSPVNGVRKVYNTFIAPDESFLVGCMTGLEGSRGMPNYGVFFRSDSGSWSGPVRMDERINPPDAQALSPFVTPDGKYFFFSSTRKRDMNAWASQGVSQNRFLELYNSPQNGNADIYWVDAKIIDELKEKIR